MQATDPPLDWQGGWWSCVGAALGLGWEQNRPGMQTNPHLAWQCSWWPCFGAALVGTESKIGQECRQTHLQCDSVVDDHGLAKDVGAVLGVGQLGVEIQPEVFIIVHLLVSKHNNLTAFFAWRQDVVLRYRLKSVFFNSFYFIFMTAHFALLKKCRHSQKLLSLSIFFS